MNIFLQKVHVENFFRFPPCPKKSTKFRCQFFLVFCFIAFLGVSQWREIKNTTKNMLQNKSWRKGFTKKSTKNPKPIFLGFIYHIFERSSVRGVQTHDKNWGGNLTSPGTFFASEEPINHVEVRHFLFKGPLRKRGHRPRAARGAEAKLFLKVTHIWQIATKRGRQVNKIWGACFSCL
jgi:hypothetical protein